jgi:hypothetical protein
MSKESFHHKIREGFGAENRQAPKDLWSAISEDISSSNPEEDLKKSFDKIEKLAPAGSWNNINRQLIIDDVWNRIARFYDRRRFIIWWSRFAGVLILACIASVGLVRLFYNAGDRVNHKEIVAANENEKPFAFHRQENPAMVIGPSTNLSLPGSNVDGSDKPDRIVSTTEQEVLNDNHNQAEGIGVEKVGDLIKEGRKVQGAVITVGDLAAEGFRETNEKQRIELMVGSSIRKIPIQLKHQGELTTVEDFKGKRPLRYLDIGLIGRIDNTWILNNDVKSGFSRSSLVQNNLSFGYASGLQANYYFSNRSAIQLEYDFLSALNQKYQFYNEGRLTVKQIDLKYQRVGLGYKYSFGTRLGKKPVLSLKFGGHFGFAKKESVKIDDQQGEESFDVFDYGIRLGVGREHFIRSFTIDYGLNSDIGLHNITSPGLAIPKKFSYTSTLAVGAYISVRYNF